MLIIDFFSAWAWPGFLNFEDLFADGFKDLVLSLKKRQICVQEAPNYQPHIDLGFCGNHYTLIPGCQ